MSLQKWIGPKTISKKVELEAILIYTAIGKFQDNNFFSYSQFVLKPKNLASRLANIMYGIYGTAKVNHGSKFTKIQKYNKIFDPSKKRLIK